MTECPIVRGEIETAECTAVTKEAVKTGKEKPVLHSKFRKVVGWKAICKSCKNHNNWKK